AGNYLGTNAAGTAGLGSQLFGVLVSGGPSGNLIGGTTAAARNVISGNSLGVLLDGANSNSVRGNYIGTDASGTAAVGNTQAGVQIAAGAQNNLIGDDGSGGGNVISGNTSTGIGISGSGTSNNTVAGNYIGLDATGTTGLANSGDGVRINGGAS